MNPQKRLKIGEVSRLLNIPAYVLRFWESEFTELHPGKSRSGQRLYDESEVEFIRKIAHLRYDEKLTIAGCRERLVQENANQKTDEKKTLFCKPVLVEKVEMIKKGLQEVLDELG